MKKSRSVNRKSSRVLSFEALELRRLLAFTTFTARPASPLTQIRTDSNVVFEFGKSSASTNPGGLFKTKAVDDIILAGDWSNLGYTSLGAARPNRTAIDSQIRWELLLSTDRDPNVDVNLINKVNFVHGALKEPALAGASNTEVMYQVSQAFAGNFDNQWGDEVALAYRESTTDSWNWIVNYGLNSDQVSSWKHFIPQTQLHTLRPDARLTHGSSDSRPVVGDFDGDGYSDIATVKHIAGTQDLSFSVSYGPDFAVTGSKVIQTNITNTTLANRLQIYTQRTAPGSVLYHIIANGTTVSAYTGIQSATGSRTPNETLGINFASRNDLGATQAGDQILIGNWPESVWTEPTNANQTTWATANWLVPQDSYDAVLDSWDPSRRLEINAALFLKRTGSTVSTIPLDVSGGEHEFKGPTDLKELNVSGGTVSLNTAVGNVGTLKLSRNGKVNLKGSGLQIDVLNIQGEGNVEVSGSNIVIDRLTVSDLGQLTLLKSSSNITIGELVISGGKVEVNKAATISAMNLTGGTISLTESLSSGTSVDVSGGELIVAAPFVPGAYSQSGGILHLQANNALGVASPLTISGGTIRSSLAQSQLSNLRLANKLALSNTVSFESLVDSYLIIQGEVSGSGELKKQGSGFLSFENGTSNYTGVITVSAGTLIHHETSVAEKITLKAGALELYGPGSISTDISLESGSLIVHEPTQFDEFTIGSGTHRIATPLTVASLNVLGGSVTIAADSAVESVTVAAGELHLAASIGTNTALEVTTNALVRIETAQQLLSLDVDDGRILVEHSAAQSPFGNASVKLTNSSLLTNVVTTTATPLQSFLIPNNVELSGTSLIGNSNTVSATASQNYVRMSGQFSGQGILRKVGQGTVLLTGDSSYSGDIQIDDGELIAGHANALGSTDGSTTVNGTGLNPRLMVIGSIDVPENIVIAGQGRLDLRVGAKVSGELSLVGGSRVLMENGTTVTGKVSIANDVALSSIDSVNTAAPLQPAKIEGQVTGIGNVTLETKAGLTLELSNQRNDFQGSTTITGDGSVQLGGNSVLPEGRPIRLNADAELLLNGHSVAVSEITGDGRIRFGNGTLQVNAGDFSGSLVEDGIFRKISSQLLALADLTAFDGNLEIDAGTLRLKAPNLTSAVDVVVANSAVLDLERNSQSFRSVTGLGSVRADNATLTIHTLTDSEFGGTFSGGLQLLKRGSGKLTLANTSTHTQSTRVEEGTVTLMGKDALGSGALSVFTGANVEVLNAQRVTNLNVSGNVTVAGVVLQVSGDVNIATTGRYTGDASTIETVGAIGSQVLDLKSASIGTLLINGGSSVSLLATSATPNFKTALIVQAGDLKLGETDITVPRFELRNGASVEGNGVLTVTSQANLHSGFVKVALAGEAVFRKLSNTKVTLTVPAQYSGSTIVQAGELSVEINNGLGSGPVEIWAAGTLNFIGIQSLSAIQNSGNLTASSATIRLSDDLTNTGALSIGTLETVGTAGNVQEISLGQGVINNLTTRGASDIRVEATQLITMSGVLRLLSGSMDLGTTSLATQQVVLNGNSQTELRGSGVVTSNAPFDLRNGVVAVTLRGTAGATKSAANGVVQLNDSNEISGPIVIQSGQLIANAQDALAGEITVNAGAILDVRNRQRISRLENSGVLSTFASEIVLTGDFINSGKWNSGTSVLIAESSAAQRIDLGVDPAHSITMLGPGEISLQGSASEIEILGILALQGGTTRLDTAPLRVSSFSMSGNSTIIGQRVTSQSDFQIQAGKVRAPLAGAVGLIKTSAGILDLDVANEYSGQTLLLDTGVVNANVNGSLGTGPLQVGNDARLNVNGTQSVQSISNQGSIALASSIIRVQGAITSPGSILHGSSTIELNGTSEQRIDIGPNQLHNLFLTGDGNTVRLTTSQATANVAGTLRIQSGELELGNHSLNAGVFELAGSDDFNQAVVRGTGTLRSNSVFDVRNGVIAIELTGDAGLRKSTEGTVRIDVPSSYTGETRVVDGSLVANSSNTISMQSPIVVEADGSLDFSTFSQKIHSISNQGNVQVRETEVVVNNSLNNEIDADFNASNTTLVLFGDFNNRGVWSSPTSSIDWLGTADRRTFSSGGAIFESMNHAASGELVIADSATVTDIFTQEEGSVRLGGGDLSVGGLVWQQGELLQGSDETDFKLMIERTAEFKAGDIWAPVVGAEVWTKTESGRLTFHNRISYGTRLDVQAGEVGIAGQSALPFGKDVRIDNEGTLVINSGDAVFRGIVVNGLLQLESAVLVIGSSGEGQSSLEQEWSVTGEVVGVSGLIKLGDTDLNWNGVNNVKGSYEVQQGRLVLLSDQSLNPDSSLMVAREAGVQILSSQVVNKAIYGEGEISVDETSRITTQGGEYSGTLLGKGELNKQGEETFWFTDKSRGDFGGRFNIESGKVIMDGAFPELVAEVGAAAVLAGKGTLGSVTVLANGVLSPGSSPGTMRLNSLVLSPDAVLQMELEGQDAGSGYDQLIVAGHATLDGNVRVSLSDQLRNQLLPHQWFNLITFASATSTATGFIVSSLGDYIAEFHLLSSAYQLVIQFPIPQVGGPTDLPTTIDCNFSFWMPIDKSLEFSANVVISKAMLPSDVVQPISIVFADDEQPEIPSGDIANIAALSPIDPSVVPVEAALLDSLITKGLALDLSELNSGMKPLQNGVLDSLSLPKLGGYGQVKAFPSFNDSSVPETTFPPYVMVACGIVTTLIGTASALLGIWSIRKARSERDEEKVSVYWVRSSLSPQDSSNKAAHKRHNDIESERAWTIEDRIR